MGLAYSHVLRYSVRVGQQDVEHTRLMSIGHNPTHKTHIPAPMFLLLSAYTRKAAKAEYLSTNPESKW